MYNRTRKWIESSGSGAVPLQSLQWMTVVGLPKELMSI